MLSRFPLRSSDERERKASGPLRTDCWLDTQAGDAAKEKETEMPLAFLLCANLRAEREEEVVGSFK